MGCGLLWCDIKLQGLFIRLKGCPLRNSIQYLCQYILYVCVSGVRGLGGVGELGGTGGLGGVGGPGGAAAAKAAKYGKHRVLLLHFRTSLGVLGGLKRTDEMPM